jgi:GTP-binding protein
MLTDRATINVRGGHGGNGSVSMRHEPHVPKGGPDGGNGAPGGDVVLVASRQVRDLSSFRHAVHHRARPGGNGRRQQRNGRTGEALLVEVPIGTEVRERDGELLGDLVREGQRVTVARGGEGGRGNVCFVSSRRRAPRFAERGLPGEERWITLTLKLLADVGLVGLPNAGKSSLLAALTRAHPKIAPYPFTTLEPNLGTLSLADRTIVLADIPGLVEGASEGTGLGDRFLAHIERTSVLLYVVDGSEGEEAASAALHTVRAELTASNPGLSRRPGLLALNKIDLMEPGAVAATLAGVATAGDFAAAVAVSAAGGDGLDELIEALDRATEAVAPPPAPEEPEAAPAVLRPGGERVDAFVVERDDDAWRVRGATLERLVAKADLDNADAVRYLQEVMDRAGVGDALRRAGAVDGDTVLIGEADFELA